MCVFSPSDLDADLEDNQDYDSTVSQPDTNSSNPAAAGAEKNMDVQSSTPLLLDEGIAAAAASDQDQSYRTLTRNDIQAQERSVSKDDRCLSMYAAEADDDACCSGDQGALDRGGADICNVLEQVESFGKMSAIFSYSIYFPILCYIY